MAGIFGRISNLWKAAAGCAICASLVAGIAEDARHWVWDRTVGLVFPAQATFDTCLSRQMRALRRPEGALYQVIVTVPLGDRDQVAFRTIETSLTRAYGETQDAAIRVGSLDCEPLKPSAGDAADRIATAEARADALLAGTGADAILWGEVFADGKTMELRFAHPRDPDAQAGADRAAVYQAGAITLDVGFGKDIGALIAARALERTASVVGGDQLDQAEVSARILTLLSPLVAERPDGIDDTSFAEVLFSEALAAGTVAAAVADGPALLAASDRLLAAKDLYAAEATAKRDLARIFAALFRGNAASMLPAIAARDALTAAVAEMAELGTRVEALFGPDLAQQMKADLGLAMTLAGVLMPEPEQSRWMEDGIGLLREAALALPEARTLLGLASGLAARSGVSDGAAAIALEVEAAAAIDRALAALPPGDRSVAWLRAMTLKGQLLTGRIETEGNQQARATADEAIAVLTEAVEASEGTSAAADRAKAQAALGWVLVRRSTLSDDPAEASSLVTLAERALNEALTVYGPGASPLLWAWSLEGLAWASVACGMAPGCGDPVAQGVDTHARFLAAAEAYRVAGHDPHYSRALVMAQKYGTAP